jgi:hypothetical protein
LSATTPAPLEKTVPFEGDVALVGEQILACDAHRHQRCRARGLDVQRGAAQVQLVGRARGEKILFIRDDRVDDAHGVHEVAPLPDEKRVISVVARPGENADQAGEARSVAAGVLKRLPCEFQKEAMLRVHDFRFLWRDAEEKAVEPLRLLDDAAGGDVAWQRAQRFGVVAGGVQFLIGKMGDAVFSSEKVLPEIGDTARAWKTPCHPDDRDAVRIRVGAVVHGTF